MAMKFRSLVLKNFQKHKLLKIQFSPHITTIKGRTDRGKSSILRALKWLCLNNLIGNEFIRTGSSKAKVGLSVKDHRIVREKGASNLYVLDGKEFRAFGSKVPDS